MSKPGKDGGKMTAEAASRIQSAAAKSTRAISLFAETPHGDVITIACDETGMRHHRRVGRLAARRRLLGQGQNELWTIPAEAWGTDPTTLLEALMCLHDHPAVRARLSPGLLTDLLIHGSESEVSADAETPTSRGDGLEARSFTVPAVVKRNLIHTPTSIPVENSAISWHAS